jgi:autotransporter-associated beta strand protein
VAGSEGSGTINTLSGVISGSGGFTQLGAGTTILAGANTYTGATVADPGLLQIGNGTSGSVGTTSALSTDAGGTLGFDEANGSVITNDIANSGTVAGLEGAGDTNTLSGIISGAGSFTQTDAGTTILTGANTYTGATSVNAGSLLVGDVTSGSITDSSGATVASGATLAFNEANGSTDSVAIANNGTVKGAQNVGSVNTLSGNISGTGSFVQSGTGITILTGDNTYSGGMTIADGKVYVNNTSGSGTGSGGVAVDNGATLAGSGTIVAGGGGVVLNTGATLSSGRAPSGSTTAGTGLTLNNAAQLSSILSVNSANIIVSLGAGSTTGAGPGSYTPNTNTTFLTVVGNTEYEINFAGEDSFTIDDLSATSSLASGDAYLLISAGLDSDYYGLVTEASPGGVLSLDGNGVVVGVYDGTGSLSNYTAIALNEIGVNGQDESTANPAQLYLDNGALEALEARDPTGSGIAATPEPRSWIFAIGVMGCVFVLKRRMTRMDLCSL